MAVDVAHRVHERRALEVRVLERERALPVQARVGVRIHGRSVGKLPSDVDVVSGDRQLECFGGRRIIKKKATALDECPDFLGHVLLECRHAREAHSIGGGGILCDEVTKPRRVAIAQVELVELPREILVVEVQPVELGEVALLHLVVVDRRKVDAGILERERDGVVPRLRLWRRVHGDARCPLERNALHVGACDVAANGGELCISHRLDGNSVERCSAAQLRRVGHEKRAAAIVEQPFRLHAGLHRVVGQAIGLEVIGLCIIHRHEQTLSACGGRREYERKRRTNDSRVLYELGGTVPRSCSSSRRACGSSALCGALRMRCSKRAVALARSPRRRRARAHSSSLSAASGVPGKSATIFCQMGIAASPRTPLSRAAMRSSAGATAGSAAAASTNFPHPPALSPRASARNARPTVRARSVRKRAMMPNPSVKDAPGTAPLPSRRRAASRPPPDSASSPAASLESASAPAAVSAARAFCRSPARTQPMATDCVARMRCTGEKYRSYVAMSASASSVRPMATSASTWSGTYWRAAPAPSPPTSPGGARPKTSFRPPAFRAATEARPAARGRPRTPSAAV